MPFLRASGVRWRGPESPPCPDAATLSARRPAPASRPRVMPWLVGAPPDISVEAAFSPTV